MCYGQALQCVVMTPLSHLVCSALFDHFEPISLCKLVDIVQKSKPTTSSVDIIPTRLFRDVLGTVGPSV